MAPRHEAHGRPHRRARGLTLRIGVDGTPLIGARTGIGNYTHDLVAAVAALPEQPSLSVWPVTWRRASHAEVPTAPNVSTVQRFAPARVLREAWHRGPVPPLEAFVRCDVFHATNFLAPRSWRTPVVVTVHDLWFLEHPEADPGSAALARAVPAMIERAAAVVTVSSSVADDVTHRFPRVADRVHPIPIAAHPRQPGRSRPPGLPDSVAARGEGPPFGLVLGSVNARKNLPLALATWAQLHRAGPGLPLVVAGGVAAEVDVAAELRRAGLTPDTIHLLGFVTDPEVTWLLEQAGVLLSTSVHEGFGIPLVEAMAHRTPVVALDGGAVGETTAGAAVLVRPGPQAATELADAVLDVVAGGPGREALVDRGVGVAASYTWERTARATYAVYEDVVRGR